MKVREFIPARAGQGITCFPEWKWDSFCGQQNLHRLVWLLWINPSPARWKQKATLSAEGKLRHQSGLKHALPRDEAFTFPLLCGQTSVYPLKGHVPFKQWVPRGQRWSLKLHGELAWGLRIACDRSGRHVGVCCHTAEEKMCEICWISQEGQENSHPGSWRNGGVIHLSKHELSLELITQGI